MTKCQETGCDQKATHKYRAPAGFKVPLCDRHYKLWERYEDKRTPIMMLTGFGKGLIRVAAVLMLIAGVLTLVFGLYSIAQNTELSFEMNLGLVFAELHLKLETAQSISAAGAAITLIGAALFFIGFMIMEHDLW